VPPTAPEGSRTGPPAAPPDLADLIRETIREELASASPRRLLTPDEVAEWLGVSKRTVESLVGLGEIPVVRIGTGKRKLPRYQPEAVEAFIRRQARGA